MYKVSCNDNAVFFSSKDFLEALKFSFLLLSEKNPKISITYENGKTILLHFKDEYDSILETENFKFETHRSVILFGARVSSFFRNITWVIFESVIALYIAKFLIENYK